MSDRDWISHDGSARVLLGDVRQRLADLPERSIHAVVTSPPYWALRDYGVEGQLGSEKTPEEYLAKMVDVFRGVRRVLRDDGVCWVNMGNSYDAGTSSRRQPSKTADHGGWTCPEMDHRTTAGIGPGNQLLMPHRLALAMQADGWTLRSTIVWAKRCLSGGTWLYARTQKGDSPAMLKDLVRLDPSTVQLWDGAKWVRVLGWSRVPDGSDQEHLEIELRSGERICCTGDHRWPTDRGVLFASELTEGDVINTCRIPEPKPVEPLCLPDADFGWLAGFYLAEGFCFEKGVIFAIHSRETEAAARIERLAKLVGGTASMKTRKGNSAVVVVYSKTLRAFLQDFITGDNCRNKRLGRKAWMRGNAFLAAVLDGYLEGDGHWDERGFHALGFTNNDGLAVDLRCLGARLNKVCVLRRVVHKCNGKRFPGWRGRIREHSGHPNAEPAGKVVAIRKSRAREFWDVSVDQEPNLFALASGVLTHNSPMPESLSGWRWVRCRVKVGGGWCSDNPHPSASAGGRLEAQTGAKYAKYVNAKWSPCPGCEKCRDTGGYVLRRGAWRCTTAHEYVFQFTNGMRYFGDSENCKERSSTNTHSRGNGTQKKWGTAGEVRSNSGFKENTNATLASRNPRSVWTLSSEPFKLAHFATFPGMLVYRCLLASTSKAGCCPKCGAGWAPVVESERVATRPGNGSKVVKTDARNVICGRLDSGMIGNRDPQRHETSTAVTGYRPTCECDPLAGGTVTEALNGGYTPVPMTVLDPFSGSGTTGQVALSMGLRYIGIELSPEYLEMSKTRILTPWKPKHERNGKPRWKQQQKQLELWGA